MLKYRGSGLVKAGLIGVVLAVMVILVGLSPDRFIAWATMVRYQALFTEAGGLATGNPVVVSGMKVGTVSDVKLHRGDALVTFALKGNILLGSETTAHIRTGTLLGERMLTLESAGTGTMHPMALIPVSRTSSPYSLTEAVSDLTTDTAGTNTTALNQSLDTLAATLDQIAPQMGPAFDALTRLSRTLNSRNKNLGELFKSAGDVTGVLSERSQQVNKLILNSDVLLQVLVARRQEIVDLLANTSAVAKQLTALVHDNESKLAPTLERLNSVTAMLEKNRDNISKALPGLKKFEITVGEAIFEHVRLLGVRPELPCTATLPAVPGLPVGIPHLRHGSRSGPPLAGSSVADSLAVQRDSGMPRLHVGWPGRRVAMSPRVPRNRLAALAAVVLVGLIVAGAAVLVRNTFFGQKTITAYFTTATAIYPNDEVRVSGVKVGNIKSIEPQGTQAKMTLKVDHDVPIPADAKAVIVASNLVSARYVQLSPAYRDSGPVMPDGAVIPVERTAVPVEWDEVKTQLMRLATDLGPKSGVSGTSVGRFIDSAANALDGNGDKLRQTLAQLSGVGRILANGSGNIVDIIKNLQTFVGALRDSNVQIVQFNDRLATLTSVVNDSKSDLDAALTDLSTAVGEVQRFIAGTRNQTSEQIARLADVTQILVDHHMDLENILHAAPNALGNFFNDYNADTGTIVGGFGIMNFANPTFSGLMVPLPVPGCTAVGAIENITAVESGKLCSLFLGPGLRVLNFNNLPIPINIFLQKSVDPSKILYSEPRLAPGGEGPKPGPPEIPPAVSAYTGLPGDPVGPPGAEPPARIPGAAMPLPPPPSTPMPPPPPPEPGVSGMLLPAQGPQQ